MGAVEVTNLPSATTINGASIPLPAIGSLPLVVAPFTLNPGEESHTLHALPGGHVAVFWFQADKPLSVSIDEVLANMGGRVMYFATTSRVEAFRWDLGSNHVTLNLKNIGTTPVNVSAGWLLLFA